MAIGLVAVAIPVRLLAYGWVDLYWVQPTFHFAWVRWAAVPDRPVLFGLVAALIPLGAAIAAGVGARPALVAYVAVFGYLELLDKTLYLNHYVLFTLLLATLAAVPAGGFGPEARAPRWALVLLRAELGLVYLWAGLCKLGPDWLLRGEPLHTWLSGHQDLPVVGPWLATREVALAMSWGGAAYDLSIPFLLLGRRTRWLAAALIAGFHAITGLLFPIGVFPWLMVLATPIFLDPDWPRFGRSGPRPQPARISTGGGAALAAVLAVLALVPARFLLYGGQVTWDERGYRFAWRVLLVEKTGFVEYRVVDRATGRARTVHPADELTPLQHQQMRFQPDLILDYGHHLGDLARAEGWDPAVYADSWASLNRRPAQRLVDPNADLTRVDPWSGDWIVPLEAR